MDPTPNDANTLTCALASQAYGWSDDDHNSARQIAAFNDFIVHCEATRPDLFLDNREFEDRIEKATSDEIVDAALERLGIPKERRPWRLGERAVLPDGYEAYPHFLIKEPLTGTVVDLRSRGFVFVKLDAHRPELDEWDNILHVYEDEFGQTPRMVRET